MKKQFASILIATSLVGAGLTLPMQAVAQSELSAISTLSLLPVGSVLGTASVVAGAVVVVPAALSATGAVLFVKTVEVSAKGTVYLLERASDGAQVSIEILGKGVQAGSMAVGASVTVTVIGAGVVLSAAGQAIAFIPNELGRALLHNERVTR